MPTWCTKYVSGVCPKKGHKNQIMYLFSQLYFFLKSLRWVTLCSINPKGPRILIWAIKNHRPYASHHHIPVNTGKNKSIPIGTTVRCTCVRSLKKTRSLLSLISLSQNLSYRLKDSGRSEEHTSELQSRLHLVCRLLLEKKKKKKKKNNNNKSRNKNDKRSIIYEIFIILLYG